MTTSIGVHALEVGAIEATDPLRWRALLATRLRAGMRVVTLYGRPDGDRVAVTAVLEGQDRAIWVSRTRVEAAVGYHELTSEFPALHAFERELHEQHGVRIAGHPWLKPVRYQGRDQTAMKDFPYYRIDGKEVHEVAVGPIHAGVIEPGAFRFLCLGEQVLHLEIQLGYQHRGVEARLLERDPLRLTPWIETIAGDSSVAHAWAYCAAIERLAGCEVSAQAEVARAFALELERVGMHLAGLAGMAADIGFLPGAATYGRLRTTALNTSMRLCGSRFGRGALRPGRVGMRLDRELATLVRDNLALMQRDLAEIDDCFGSARSVQHRLKGVGVVTADTARELGLVGPVARASGIALDGRAGAGGAYAARPIKVCVETTGDCWARAGLRIDELDASLAWLAGALEDAPAWPPAPVAVPRLAASQLVVAIAEGWRGEVVHCLETDAAGALLHYKVQDPSLRNWMGLALAVRGNPISDFPICNKSFDLSYCGHDL